MRVCRSSALKPSLQEQLRNHANQPIEKLFVFHGDEPAQSGALECSVWTLRFQLKNFNGFGR